MMPSNNFYNYVPAFKNIESTFEAKLSLKEKGKKMKKINQIVKRKSMKS